MTDSQTAVGRVPSARVRAVSTNPVNHDGSWVMYLMRSARRARFNFALQHAADWARHLGKPLVVFDLLRCDERWASDRFHSFVIDGMADNATAFAPSRAVYLPGIEPESGAGATALETIAAQAALVVTDDHPISLSPTTAANLAAQLPVRLVAVDGNGILPMAAAGREHATAYAFRRFVQKNLFDHLRDIPLENPLADDLPAAGDTQKRILESTPWLSQHRPGERPFALEELPIDHGVAPTSDRGGAEAARRALDRFLFATIDRYAEERNRPEAEVTSGLAPYLHHGHISSHEVFLELMRSRRWDADDVVPPANGRRAGWWGVDENSEAFLDQLITWRELGFNVCHHRENFDRWESLPDWAQRTLTEHVIDPRDHLYSVEGFASAATHDPLWNAAQTQLVREGTIHNYLRMLWGKKILEWTAEPREALEVMIELNNRYALDGRDPNSYTGIFWVLGRHDRPWGPERPIFGKVRYMSSKNTARKFPVKAYLERFGEGS